MMNKRNQIFLGKDTKYDNGFFIHGSGPEKILYYPPSQEFDFFSDVSELDRIKEQMKKKPNIIRPKINKYRVEITDFCNARCDYCLVYKNRGEGSSKHMSSEIANRLVEQYNEEVGKEGDIMIIGGEPLLNWDATRIFIEKCQGKIHLYTNGVAIDDEKIDVFYENGTRVFISLDGADRKSNSKRKLTNGKEMFPTVMENFKNLMDKNIPVNINTVVSDETVGDMEMNLKTFVEDMGCRAFGIAYPHYTEFSKTPLDISKYTNNMLSMFDYSKEKGVFVYQIARRIENILSGNYKMSSCKILSQQRTFNADGIETGCSTMRALEKTKNITIEDLRSTLPIRQEYCHNNCISESVCGGGCYFDGRIYEEDIPVDIRECEFNIKVTEKMLNDMLKEHIKNGLTSREDFMNKYRDMITRFK